ncbi:MAG: Isoaspartyl dipeptidase [Candidatus Heimdallarchaeota archaeon LC_3]|nr:MAG: Isoaspartyl dipeptidase [Candidatus Heimdallarchaeota archaeon LC_3]
MNSNQSMILLKGGEVFSPKYLGVRDILIGGKEILSISEESLEIKPKKYVKAIDLNNKVVIPGLIDLHEHLIGGGGEDGPTSRTPEAKISELIKSGVTTAVGVLGTDSISRSLNDLLTKVRSLNLEHFSAFMYTGAYRYPSPTITGDVMKDIMLIDQILGVKIALSDHRSSFASLNDLAKLTSDVRVAGLLGKKPGIIHIHMGSAKEKLDIIWQLLDDFPLPITQFHPTHMNRNEELITEGKKFVTKGGHIDFTADPTDSLLLETLMNWSKDQQLKTNVTLSSDAYGSLPKFNSDGKLIGIDVGKPDILIKLIKILFLENNLKLPDILPFFTSNPAIILHLTRKGMVQINNNADLLVLSPDLELEYVFCNGKVMKTPSWIFKGKFEHKL